jgi:hypothetical protein
VRESTQKFSSAVAFATVAAFILVSSTGILAQPNNREANLNVLVFNYSKASDSVLSQASGRRAESSVRAKFV